MGSIDVSIFNIINGWSAGSIVLNNIMIFISVYSMFILFAYVVLSWLFYKRKEKHRTILLASANTFIISFIVSKILSLFINHTPPYGAITNVNLLIEHDVNNSFPSYLAMMFFSVAFTIYFFTKAWNGGLFIFISIIVGISQIWVGVKYPSDVLITLVICLIVALIISSIARNTEALSKPIKAYNRQEAKLMGRDKDKKQEKSES